MVEGNGTVARLTGLEAGVQRIEALLLEHLREHRHDAQASRDRAVGHERRVSEIAVTVDVLGERVETQGEALRHLARRGWLGSALTAAAAAVAGALAWALGRPGG